MGATPAWWLTQLAAIGECLESLDGVATEAIGRSAGGRPIVAAFWGEREDLPGRTARSLGSAMGACAPAAFYGQGRRSRETLLFVGAAHGTELEGTVAAVNLLNVVVTGRDLRGREWPRLAAEARRLRLVVVPVLNPDGRQRYAEHEHFLNADRTTMDARTFGRDPQGRPLAWQVSKRHFPLRPPAGSVLGSYFNDHGVNLVYDRPGPDCQPETAALLRLCDHELPDLTLLSHSNWGSLIEPPGSYLPMQQKIRVLQLGAVVGNACRARGFVCNIPQTLTGPAPYQFYQSDLLYHACGTLPVLVEFPAGNAARNRLDLDGILDVGLCCLEEVIAFVNAYGCRPTDLTG